MKKVKKMEHNVKKNVPKSVPNVPKELLQKKEEKCNSLYLEPFTKVRVMCLQLYCEPKRWQTALDKCSRYAYILHDKDIDSNGNKVTPHYHLVLQFPNPRTRHSVEKDFDLEGLTEDTTINFQKCKSLGAIVGYLTHKTNACLEAKKHIYSYDEVVSNDLGYFIGKCNDVEEVTVETMIDDINSNEFTYRRLASKYGRDFIKNARQYIDYAHKCEEEEARQRLRREVHEPLEKILTDTDNAEVFDNDYEMIAKYLVLNYGRSAQKKVRAIQDYVSNLMWNYDEFGKGEII